jgi:uncharacterized protein (TIGR02246 family)
MAEDAQQVASTVAKRLTDAWNAADGDAFGASFAEDVEFITVWGSRVTGRREVAAGHKIIFSGMYKDSSTEFRPTAARTLADGIIAAYADGVLKVPAGDMAGEHPYTASMVIMRQGSEWKIVSFHNNWIAASPQSAT